MPTLTLRHEVEVLNVLYKSCPVFRNGAHDYFAADISIAVGTDYRAEGPRFDSHLGKTFA